MNHSRITLAALALVLLVAGGLATRSPHPTTGPRPVGVAEALTQLQIAPETANGPYDRAAFGGWATGEDGCDTRQRVLIDESRQPAQVAPGCAVDAGDWVSVYDGYQTTDPTELEIDHVVALGEAWSSGASQWSSERRHEFANDLTHSGALVAVTAATNRAKSDHDPAEWMPPSTEHWCDYAAAWIDQKHTWGLTVDAAEHDALVNILAGCAARGAIQ